jgi:phage terminase large subunit
LLSALLLAAALWSPPMSGRTLDIPTPAAFEPLLQPSRYKGAHGGRGSAKSHFFADLLIDYALTRPALRVVCIREVQKTLAQSVKLLIEDKIKTYGIEADFVPMTSHIILPGGGICIFVGMQEYNAQSVKSLEGFDVAWIEEAQSLSQRSLDLLRPTIRKEGSEIWASWNPDKPTDPIDVLLRKDPPPGSVVVEASYNDNPFFPDVLRREMEWDKRRDYEKYEHVWEGAYQKHSESRVFKNWKQEEFETPKDAIFYFGADWGFSVDPSTLVRCHLAGERKLYIDYEAYQIGVEIDHLGELFDRVPGSREWEIVADSARPETISYLQRHGFPRMVAARKGPNSVKEGVIFLQNYDIIVHPRCVQTIKELTHYSYKVDRMTGMVTPILKDDKNHIIDPLRYATEKLRQPVVEDWVVA